MVVTLAVMTVTVATPVAVVTPNSLKMIQILEVIPAVAAEPTPVAEPMKSKVLAVVPVAQGMVMVPVKAQVKV